MQCRFKMEYKLFTIVRYNYRDYNSICTCICIMAASRIYVYVLPTHCHCHRAPVPGCFFALCLCPPTSIDRGNNKKRSPLILVAPCLSGLCLGLTVDQPTSRLKVHWECIGICYLLQATVYSISISIPLVLVLPWSGSHLLALVRTIP
jgi:hypothetical protein